MQVDFLDRFSRGTSVVHRWDARWKLLSALALVAAIISTPGDWWLLYQAEATIIVCVYSFARLPWRYLAVRLLAVLPFLLLVACGVPLSRGFESGWDIVARLLIRSILSLTVMITLVATTRFGSLLAALASFHVPHVLISILAFMYRYMYVLTDELGKMRRAKLARTFYPSLSWEIRLMANFVGILFVRAFERAERIYAAMCARGWSGTAVKRDGD